MAMVVFHLPLVCYLTLKAKLQLYEVDVVLSLWNVRIDLTDTGLAYHIAPQYHTIGFNLYLDRRQRLYQFMDQCL
jgi:hypothetical protein